MRRRKGTLLKDGKKVCTTCSQEKASHCFSKDKNRTDGLSHTCKECRWDERLRREYGITAADYLKISQDQDDKCDICKRDSHECNVKGCEKLIVKMNTDTNRYHLICHFCSMRVFGPSNRKGTLAKDGIKKCSICQEDKVVREFRRDVYRKDGYASRCKECDRAMHLKSSYGISPDDYDRMVAKQNNRCECCSLTKTECNHPDDKPWFVDHCHKTGAVRGLVCHNCNILIGYAETLRGKMSVFDYLHRYESRPEVPFTKTLSA